MADYNESSIATLEGLAPVRKHAGMYGFELATQQGQYQIIKEVIDNSFDEAMIDPNNQHQVDLIFCKDDKKGTYQVIIKDDGRGAPLGSLDKLFGKLHTSGKWKGAYSVSTGTFGVGAKGTNALSDKFVVVSSRKDGVGVVNFEQSVLKDYYVDSKFDGSNNQGTLIFFEPDASLFTGLDKFFEDGQGYHSTTELIELVHVFMDNLNVSVYLSDKPVSHSLFKKDHQTIIKTLLGKRKEKIFETKRGRTPVDYLIEKNNLSKKIMWSSGIFSKAMDDSIQVTVNESVPPVKESANTKRDPDVKTEPVYDDGKVGYDVEFFLTSDFEKTGPKSMAAINMIMIQDRNSYHISGLSDAVKHYLINYVENKDVANFFKEKYTLPFHLVIMAKYKGATFVHQDKRYFREQEFLAIYKNHLIKNLSRMTDDYWKSCFDMIENDLMNKFQKDLNKDFKTTANAKKNFINDLKNPGSLYECRHYNPEISELYIVEGKTAAGNIVRVRNVDYQAVYWIRGKPINPFQGKAFLQDKIFKDLCTLCNINPSSPNLDAMRFKRIIIATDADEHGYHIAALLLGLFYKVNPKIIEEGRVYISNPPMFEMKVGGKKFYVHDKNALKETKYQVCFGRALDFALQTKSQILRLNEMQKADLCATILQLGDLIKAIAAKCEIEDYLVEMMAYYIDHWQIDGSFDIKGIKETLQCDSVVYENNCLVLDTDGEEIIIPLDKLYDELKIYLLPRLKKMNWNEFDILVSTKTTDEMNDKPVSIMELYKYLKHLENVFGTKKFKGLGGLDKHGLKSICMDPMTRKLKLVNGLGDYEQMVALLGPNSQHRKALVISNETTMYE